MVSTLDILKKEKDLVDEINHCDRCIAVMISQLEDVKNNPIDCETRTHDIGVLESMIKEYQEDKSELLKKLDEVQNELREHLKQMLS